MENGIKINVEYQGVKKEDVMLFEKYAYDLIDMIPLGNLEEAISAGASTPEKFFKVIYINEDACELALFDNKENSVLKIGDAIERDGVSIELVGIRFNAENFDDWKTS